MCWLFIEKTKRKAEAGRQMELYGSTQTHQIINDLMLDTSASVGHETTDRAC